LKHCRHWPTAQLEIADPSVGVRTVNSLARRQHRHHFIGASDLGEDPAEYCLRVARRMVSRSAQTAIPYFRISVSSPLLGRYDEPELLPSSSR
jgi:hypothetical protein